MKHSIMVIFALLGVSSVSFHIKTLKKTSPQQTVTFNKFEKKDFIENE